MVRCGVSICWMIAWFACGGAAFAQDAPSNEGKRVDFTRDVRPILADRCYTCHGPDEQARTTELRLDRRESAFADLGDGRRALVAGETATSELVRRITNDDPDERMPPPDAKRQLTPEQIETLVKWVEQGAAWDEHWSLVPPQRPEFPAVRNRAWPINGIDWFVLARLEREGLAPSPAAAKETLLRRVTLDLTGLPPTLAELDAFLADESPRAYEHVVDRLLQSPRYGEHMALPWLDAARYADSNGYQGEMTRTLWPWRDWVVQALNDNMPFDQFTIEQLAGDLLPEPTRAQLVATGFHRNHMLNGEGGRIAEESRVDYVVDRVNTTATTWLGLTIACCQCHDHKYDPFPQTDFYRLYAYFNSIDESGAVDANGNARPVLPLPTAEQEDRERELVAALDEAKTRLAAVTSAEHRARWEERTRAALVDPNRKPYWQPLAPRELASQNGQTLELQEDGAVFVSGANPEKDNYTLVYETDAERITGLRLDVLKHDSFTDGGLARSDSGNFVLTEFEVVTFRRGPAGRASDVDVEKTSPATDARPAGPRMNVKIASAEADFEQGGLPVKAAFDGNPNTGWAVHKPGDMKHDRAAVFVFAEPLAGGAGTVLEVRLKHESPHKHHNIGRFRISLTTEPAPKLAGSNELPANVIAALSTAEGDRNDEQKKAVDEQFRKSDADAASAQEKVNEAGKTLNDFRNSFLKTMVMRDLSQPRETYRLKRGVWNDPDRSELLAPGVPGVLPMLPEDAPANRLALARWLVSGENPLTARVIVNRFWQQFFGMGLVKTAEDFGTQGEPPSHPDLLDWLAVEFAEGPLESSLQAASRDGTLKREPQRPWDMKGLVRLIVTSATYRQSSVVRPELVERDPENRLLARGPRLRLTAQAIRDQALYVSGLLVEKVGGPPVKPYQPDGVWQDLTLGKISYQQDHGDDLYRRSLYTFWRRSVAPTMLFDVPSRQVCVVKQTRTNTPLHALTLLNDVTYVEAARKLAERVHKDGGTTPEERVAHALRLVTCRRPTGREVNSLVAVLERLRERYAREPQAAAELLKIGETPADPSLPAVELAAYAGVMNVVLNLDEVVTKE
jgi:mono/diheme cytochrome c family protein